MKRDLSWVRWAGLAWVSLVLGIAFSLSADGALSAAAQSPNPLRVIESNTSHVVLELNLSSYNVGIDRFGGAAYSTISVPDLDHTADPGNPQLPMEGALVGIPPGAQPSLRIVADQPRADSLPNPPVPVPTPKLVFDPRQRQLGSKSDTFTLNAAAYSGNQFYPSVAAKAGSTGNWRSQHYLTVQFYPFQYNPATRQLLFHERLRVEITFSYPRGPTQAAIGGPVNEGPFEAAFQKSFVNYESAKNWRSRTLAPASTPRAPSIGSSDCPNGAPCYRIGVVTDGIYQLTCGQIAAAAGGGSLNIDPTTLRMFNLGTELAINVVGNGWNNGSCITSDQSDYVEFFGQGPAGKDPDIRFKYSGTNVYWLTYGNVTGKRMLTRNGGIGGGTLTQTFTNTLHLEQNLFYGYSEPLTENFEHWYWDYMSTGSTIGSQITHTVSFPLPQRAAGSNAATLQLDLVGFSLGMHHTIIALNSCNSLDNTSWGPGAVERLATVTFSQSCLLTTTNTIYLTEQNDTANVDTILTNFFNIGYQSTFNAITDTARFQQPVSGTWKYQVAGFTTGSNIETFAVDIGNPYNVVQILNTTATLGGSTYSLGFTDLITSPTQYIALTPAQRLSPASVTFRIPPANPTSLLCNPLPCDSSHYADYIILYNGALKAAVQPLANLRAGQMRVKMIDVQNVYDEFSDGVVDAQAIHDFLQYAYNNWNQQSIPNTPPSYVLLVGAGNYDPKGYCLVPGHCLFDNTPANSTLIPPYLRMVDPLGYQETASDNQLVAFNGPKTLPYMFIGRLPANTSADVNALVTKILNYENPPTGNWHFITSFVTDSAFNPDGTLNRGGNFWYFSEQIAGNPTYFPAGQSADRIYLNVCPTCTPPFTPPNPPYPDGPSAKAATISAINNGRLIVNYIGHGAIDAWGDYDQFDSGDLSSLTNGTKTPLMLELTCNTGYFIYPPLSSLAQSNVNLLANGAVASWAAAGLGNISGHDALEKGFFDAITNQRVRQFGPAIYAGKANLLSTGENLDMIDTTLLFGDPASRLAIEFPFYLPLVGKH